MRDLDEEYKRLRGQILISEPLILTGMQRRQHIDGKALFLTFIDPIKFLAATTEDTAAAVEFVVEKTAPLDYYNELHKSNKIMYPYLKIDFDEMKIIGHEGRSRVLASRMAGFQKVPVFIKSDFRLENSTDLSFPMMVSCERREDCYITLFKKDVIEFYPRSEWSGW